MESLRAPMISVVCCTVVIKLQTFLVLVLGLVMERLPVSKVYRGLKESRLQNCLSFFCVMNRMLPIVSNIKLLNALGIFFSSIQIKLIVFRVKRLFVFFTQTCQNNTL